MREGLSISLSKRIGVSVGDMSRVMVSVARNILSGGLKDTSSRM